MVLAPLAMGADVTSEPGHLDEVLLSAVVQIAKHGSKPQRIAIPADRTDLAEVLGLNVTRIVACRIRRAHSDELGYIRSTLSEGVKESSNRLHKLPWPDFKRLERPKLDALLARSDTQLLVADLDGAVAGWLAYSPGRRVDTVHWTLTRHRLRKRGVMRQLVDAAQLKHRIVYTLRGARQSHEWIVPWLASRGVTAAYQPLREWME